jgi:hypothetical protein
MPKQVTSFPHGNSQKKSADVEDSAEGIIQAGRNDKVINGSKRALHTPHFTKMGHRLSLNRTYIFYYTRFMHNLKVCMEFLKEKVPWQ